MAISDIPEFIRENYETHEMRHASAVLKTDFPQEWDDIMTVLNHFRLLKSHIILGGGNKSNVAKALDITFTSLGWAETQFDTRIVVDQNVAHSPTYKVD